MPKRSLSRASPGHFRPRSDEGELSERRNMGEFLEFVLQVLLVVLAVGLCIMCVERTR